MLHKSLIQMQESTGYLYSTPYNFTCGIKFVKFYSLFKSIGYLKMLLSIVNQDL